MGGVRGLGCGERQHTADPTCDLISTTQTKPRNDTELAKGFGITNRRIRADILSDTSGGADLAVELVLVHTVGTGRFSDMTGTASEHELVGVAILLWVEQVGTNDGLAIILKSDWMRTHHSRQKRKWIWSDCLVSPPAEGEGLADMLICESRRSNQEA
jgi:hypothetical protein